MKKNRSDAYTPNTEEPSEAYITSCGGIQPLPPLAPMEEDVPEDPNWERILIFQLPDVE